MGKTKNSYSNNSNNYSIDKFILWKQNIKYVGKCKRILNMLTNIFMTAAVIITIISGIDYFVKNKDTIRVDK